MKDQLTNSAKNQRATGAASGRHSCGLRTPFGPLRFDFDGTDLEQIEFLPPGTRVKPPSNSVQRAAVDQIKRYLRDPQTRFMFDFPHDKGTRFQRSVWAEIVKIPPGGKRTYGDIARSLRTSPRAVGGALGANPLPVMIPCHRVVARAGLGGFMGAERGWGMDIKQWLLRHEEVPQFR